MANQLAEEAKSQEVDKKETGFKGESSTVNLDDSNKHTIDISHEPPQIISKCSSSISSIKTQTSSNPTKDNDDPALKELLATSMPTPSSSAPITTALPTHSSTNPKRILKPAHYTSKTQVRRWKN